MPIALEQEYAIYNRRLTELLSQGEGQFVLIRGDEIVDLFVSYEDALKQGLRRFGNVPFLVKEIQRDEDVHVFREILC